MGYCKQIVGSYLVFFKCSLMGSVDVVRILNQWMDVAAHLERSSINSCLHPYLLGYKPTRQVKPPKISLNLGKQLRRCDLQGHAGQRYRLVGGEGVQHPQAVGAQRVAVYGARV